MKVNNAKNVNLSKVTIKWVGDSFPEIYGNVVDVQTLDVHFSMTLHDGKTILLSGNSVKWILIEEMPNEQEVPQGLPVDLPKEVIDLMNKEMAEKNE